MVRSNSTGFARNLFWSRCDVRAFWRTSLRDAISSPAGFLPDLLLRFKKSARRQGVRDAENDKSSFHYRAHSDRPSINRLQGRSSEPSATLQSGRSLPAVLLPGFCGSQAHSAIAGASNRDKRTSRLAIPAAQLASAFGVVGRGDSALPVAPNPCL